MRLVFLLPLLVACSGGDPSEPAAAPAAPPAEPAATPAAVEPAAEPAAAPAEEVWACPMHPEVTGSGAGDCSKCGMPLQARAAKTGKMHDHAMGH